MSSQSRYIAIETGISIIINTALSIGFVFLVFYGRATIPAGGPHAMVRDMAPQTFMVVLMSCLVPGLLTRRRLAAGTLPWHPVASSLAIPHVLLTAGVLAVAATVLVVAVSWAALPRLLPTGIAFSPLLISKALYGMLLAALVTPWSIRRVLR